MSLVLSSPVLEAQLHHQKETVIAANGTWLPILLRCGRDFLFWEPVFLNCLVLNLTLVLILIRHDTETVQLPAHNGDAVI